MERAVGYESLKGVFWLLLALCLSLLPRSCVLLPNIDTPDGEVCWVGSEVCLYGLTLGVFKHVTVLCILEKHRHSKMKGPVRFDTLLSTLSVYTNAWEGGRPILQGRVVYEA